MKLTDKAKKLIDGKNFASVATLMPSGAPQVTTVWVDREGDTIILNATGSRQRTMNLKRDPRVAISVYDQNNPYSSIAIRGKVVEITPKGAEEHIDKMNAKYHGTPKYPYHNPKDPRVLIKVEATNIHEM
jgi:PPOX class probable F420-dependent enzyme